MSKVKGILLWVATILFFITGLIFLPGLAGFASLFAALILFPVKKWQEFLDRMPKNSIKGIAVGILAFVVVASAPAAGPQDDGVSLGTPNTSESGFLQNSNGESSTNDPIVPPFIFANGSQTDSSVPNQTVQSSVNLETTLLSAEESGEDEAVFDTTSSTICTQVVSIETSETVDTTELPSTGPVSQITSSPETQASTAPIEIIVTEPSAESTATPTEIPFTEPSTEPSTKPATVPSTEPTAESTEAATKEPTTAPTQAPETETTQPTTVSTQPPETESTQSPLITDGEIVFVEYPETVHRNQKATVTIKGKPNTEYSITVYYKSGPSSASGLEAKVSDSDGYVSWTWKVGAKTSAGTYDIVVSGGGEEETIRFTVVVD